MNQAQMFAAKFPEASDLMVALDAAEIPSDQDWNAGATVWAFPDGSSISISESTVLIAD